MNTSSTDVVVIDYNTGNVDSVIKAIKLFDKSVKLTNDYKIIEEAKKIIMPGQGSFDFGMDKLSELGLIDLIKNKVLINKTPILGICLGMQLLAEFGYENKPIKGLGFIPGEIKKLPTDFKLPHIGWNEICFDKNEDIISGIDNNKDFYFVHSYYFDCKNKEHIIASSNYGYKFPSIVKKENIIGFQFHPEKSLKNGLKLINNFLNI